MIRDKQGEIMTDRDNPAVIVRYLLDLDDIRTEHLKSADMCIDCVNSADFGVCTFISVITVEIVTYQRKLAKLARIV